MANAKGPTETIIDIRAVVNQLEPDRLTRPVIVYPVRKPKTQVPDKPGGKYRWAPELPDDD